MVIARPMDHEDDVERLFSWLQTPELRYREFAGAREITDTGVTWQARPSTVTAEIPASHNLQLEEEYPPNQFPDQSGVRVEPVRRGPATIAPTPMPPIEPVSAGSGTFALGAAGRGGPRRPEFEEPVASAPVVQPPAPPPPPVYRVSAPSPPISRPALPMTPVPVPAPPPISTPAPPMTGTTPMPAASAGSPLLGGAYRGNDPADAPVEPGPLPPEQPQQTNEGSLDAVFGRLAGGRNRLPDPRERLRHIPGLGPPAGRPR
jgi:hypothetical protein